MKRRVSRFYNKPAGGIAIEIALIAGIVGLAYYYGSNQGGIAPTGFAMKRWQPYWTGSSDGTVNPVNALYSGNQLFNTWYGRH